MAQMSVGRSARHDRGFWKRAAAEWEQGGSTVESFCRDRGLNASTFRWWRWRLRLEREAEVGGSRDFVEVLGGVSIAEPEGEPSGFEVLLGTTARIRVPFDFDAQALVRLLWALEVGRGC